MKSFDFDTFEESSEYMQSLRNEVKIGLIYEYVICEFLNVIEDLYILLMILKVKFH